MFHPSSNKRHLIFLAGAVSAAILFFGGLFAVGYLLFNADFREEEADFLRGNFNNSSNLTQNPLSWFESSCDVSSNACTARGYDGVLPLVVISLDGFAASYFQRNSTPILNKLMSCGAHVKSLRPSFPSITFPNHYSIATGLHLESHGIVDNKFYDPTLRRSFNYKDGDSGPNSDPIWWHGEPIWVTAKRQKKRVNTYYWPGNEVLIKGYRADEWLHYNHDDPFDKRLERILDRLQRPQEARPDLIMLYYDEPDAKGHIYGVDAPEVNKVIRDVDASIGRFMEGLHRADLTQCVNLIVLSDHGMENALCNRSIDLMSMLNHTHRDGQKADSNDFITDEDFVFRGHTEGGIDTRSAKVSLDTLYNALSCKAALLPNSSTSVNPFLLYKKEDLPRRLHYANSARIEPLILNVKSGFTIFQTADPSNFCFGGRHGYDPMLESMEAIFIGHGPAFKRGIETESIGNTELYNLFCELLQVEPALNNGTEGALHQILRHPRKLSPPSAVAVAHPPHLPRTVNAIHQRQSNHCLQTCSEITGRVSAADMRLMLSDQEQHTLLDRHVSPFGIPDAPANASVIALVSSIYAVGFSQRTKLPLWASFYANSSMLEAANYFDDNVSCARNDIRLNISTTLSCGDFESDFYSTTILPSYLVPPGLGKSRIHKTEAMIITNVVPMYQDFRKGIWRTFWRMIGKWSNTMGQPLHIHLGPVFDHNHPYGLPDEEYRMVQSMQHANVPMPSHFFVIISRTNSSTDATSPISNDAMAFILPHKAKKLHDCQSDKEYFLDNSALIKDVELITGLRFFTGLPSYDNIRLRIRQHNKLWL